MKILLLSLTLLFSSSIYCQSKNYSFKDKQWVQYYQNLQLNNKWYLKSDVGFRWENGLQNKSQYILRTGLGRKYENGLNIQGGFANLGFYENNKISRIEYRTFQEISVGDSFSKLQYKNRFRLEERLFKSTNDEFSFNFRFRYRLLLKYPISRPQNSTNSQVFYILLGDEVFLNAGPNIVYNTFDRNRLLGGLGYKGNRKIDLCLMYTKEIGSKNLSNQYFKNDIIWLMIKHKLKAKNKNTTKQY